MFIEAGNILLIGSCLLLVSVIAGKTTNKLGVPTLIFFLTVGVLAGSEVIGGIHFGDANIAQLVGTIALNFILFSGGLDKIKPEMTAVILTENSKSIGKRMVDLSIP